MCGSVEISGEELVSDSEEEDVGTEDRDEVDGSMDESRLKVRPSKLVTKVKSLVNASTLLKRVSSKWKQ